MTDDTTATEPTRPTQPSRPTRPTRPTRSTRPTRGTRATTGIAFSPRLNDVADIDQMIRDLLEKEGGFVDHAADRGGPTNMGITIGTLSRHLGRTATLNEIRDLNVDIAFEIYEREYYRAPRIDTLPEELQPFIFDCAVNHGPGSAIKMLQRVCNEAGFGPIVVDGMIGPGTRGSTEEAKEQMEQSLLLALIEERKLIYQKIVERDPSQEVFLRGWLNRADSFSS